MGDYAIQAAEETYRQALAAGLAPKVGGWEPIGLSAARSCSGSRLCGLLRSHLASGRRSPAGLTAAAGQ